MFTASLESGVDTFCFWPAASHLAEEWQQLARIRALLVQDGEPRLPGRLLDASSSEQVGIPCVKPPRCKQRCTSPS